VTCFVSPGEFSIFRGKMEISATVIVTLNSKTGRIFKGKPGKRNWEDMPYSLLNVLLAQLF
jgi:hypothetical protein